RPSPVRKRRCQAPRTPCPQRRQPPADRQATPGVSLLLRSRLPASRRAAPTPASCPASTPTSPSANSLPETSADSGHRQGGSLPEDPRNLDTVREVEKGDSRKAEDAGPRGTRGRAGGCRHNGTPPPPADFG